MHFPRHHPFIKYPDGPEPLVSETSNYYDTIVIGGGQAGLAMGYFLVQGDSEFTVLDASKRIGDGWRTRWDSLQLFTQAQYSSLPGMPFPAPDGYYPTKDEMANYLETYATRFDLPVQLNTRVDTLTRTGDCYTLTTDSQCFQANNVIVATGPFHHPTLPEFSNSLDSSITHLHSSAYRNPTQLPDGDVLVVGAGNSGAEIARELATTDRRTFLSGRDTGSIPLNLFNNRVFWLLAGTVLTFDTFIGRKLKKRAQGNGDPLIRLTSKDLRQAGIKRVPRIDGVVDGLPRLEDGQILNVAAVVWATGFHPDYSWIEVPALRFDVNGYPIHDRGVVGGEPGLFFLGLPYQHTLVSATIGGVCTDARYIAEKLRTETDAEVPTGDGMTSEQGATCPTDLCYLLNR